MLGMRANQKVPLVAKKAIKSTPAKTLFHQSIALKTSFQEQCLLTIMQCKITYQNDVAIFTKFARLPGKVSKYQCFLWLQCNLPET